MFDAGQAKRLGFYYKTFYNLRELQNSQEFRTKLDGTPFGITGSFTRRWGNAGDSRKGYRGNKVAP